MDAGESMDTTDEAVGEEDADDQEDNSVVIIVVVVVVGIIVPGMDNWDKGRRRRLCDGRPRNVTSFMTLMSSTDALGRGAF